ncbi:MAG: MFS transporter [Synergistetes bacterium]|nr:MFS transporter [Synergistota bacterium]MCX8128332.1 MFS transporter [Synergistota bacterium]MDW8193009.1 MFS transporter [Synergistota bacterium]
MKEKAFKFVIILGIVSLLSDMTYEGARSIAGPFLATLGASGTVVGFVAGFGEFIGQGLRILFGYLSDVTKRYWMFTILGYLVNLLAVPLLAFAGSWQAAAFLIVAERLGKAIRTPARDAMLSHAASQIGGGRAFGIHEALDQIGALLGPAIVSLILYLKNDYKSAFLWLFLPASLALLTLLISRLLYPSPEEMEKLSYFKLESILSRNFWIYLIAIALIAAGYVDYPLIGFHVVKSGIISPNYVPLLYALAMGVDAISALLYGYLFDRWGLRVLAFVIVLSSLFAPLIFFGGLYLLILGVFLWGMGMGAQESILRALVGGMVSPEKRATAYGIFNAIYGVSWFLGSAFIGLLYDFSLTYVVFFSLVLQLVSAFIILLLSKKRDFL